jgi:hypothetical protein
LQEHRSEERNELQPNYYYHEAGYCHGRHHCPANYYYSTIIDDDYELRHYDLARAQLGDWNRCRLRSRRQASHRRNDRHRPGGSIVRVTDTSGNVGVSFVLEAHYFVKEWLPQPQCIDFNCNEYAIGPFVAIEVGGGATATPTTGPITGYALGVMVGLHHPTTDPKPANSSWNFGVELRVDPSATVFSDGVRANHLPLRE